MEIAADSRCDDRVDLGGLAGVRQEDRELVATHAGDEIGGTHGRAQAPRHLDEDVVAGLVAECVVHRLEPVEIQHDDGSDR